MKQKFLLKTMLLLCALVAGTSSAWADVVSGTTYSTPSISGLPDGWSGSDGGGTSYVKLTASDNYIQTSSFAQNGFTSIVVKARKFGGPSDAQALITVSWYSNDTETVLGTIAPSSTNLSNYTISSPNNPTGNTTGYIKIQCKEASSGKGSGVSEVTINYTSATPAYTINAASNNNSWGTVSLSGNVITATPVTGYTYASPAYTVSPANSATVVQNGDEFTVTPSANTTVTINFAAIPTHTARFSINGSIDDGDNCTVAEGAAITFPSDPADVNGKTFVGWYNSEYSNASVAPAFVNTATATMGNSDITFYAVFASVGAGSSASLTKMTSSDTFSAGDKVVIVVSDNVAMYQETINSTYVNKYTFDNNVETIAADEKKWFTVSAGATNSTWKLGDSTNGYVYNGNSNDLKIDTSNSTDFTLAWDSSNSKFTLKSGSRWLSYRDDLANTYFRMGGTGATPNGTGYFDIYKYSTGGVSYSDYCTTVAAAVAVTSVSVDATASVNVGETTTLTATISPDNATNKNVTWESDDETIATVDASGVVTGVAAGEATITVTSVADNTKTATCIVTVTTVAVTDVSVDATASVYVGGTTTLTATISPNNATNKNVTWTSSDDAIATVDENGAVTGVAAGEATITVTSVADNTKTATCTVTVSLAPGTAACPYTVAQALAAAPSNGVYVSGTISAITEVSTTYYNATYTITDGENTMTVYRGKYLNNANFTSEDQIAVGDIVVVYGNLSVYNEKNQLAQGNYLISLVRKVATPTFSPAAGAVASGTEITIECATDGATIHYTVDGTDPTTSSPTYNSAITINEAKTIKAFAVKEGLTNSSVASADYTIAVPCATPTFSPAAGTYTSIQSVTISCGTDDAAIYYTTDGTDPTSESTLYTGAISVGETMTLKAIAMKGGMAPSTVATAEYTINLPVIPANWVLTPIASLTATDVFVIVGNNGSNYAMTNGNGASNPPDASAVTVDGNILTGTIDANLQWNISGNADDGYIFYPNGDAERWLYCTSSNNGVRVGTNANKTFTVNSGYLQNTATSRYVGIYNSQDWRCYTGITGTSNIKDQTFSFFKKVTLPAKINSSGYGTFACNYAIDYSKAENFTAWQMTDIEVVAGVANVTFEKITGSVVAGTGVLLMGDLSTTVYPTVASDAGTDISSTNLLEGVIADKAVENDGDYYGLSGDQFVPVAASTVPAGKAILDADWVEAAGLVKAFTFIFDDEATGIRTIETVSAEEAAEIFDLSGRRLNKIQKGINIVNGKKILY